MFVRQQVSKTQVVGPAAKSKKSSSGTLVTGSQRSVYFCIVLIAITLIAFSISCIQAEHHEDHKHHKFNPYKYGYKVIDHKGNKQWKQEESHSPHEVKGSYGYKDKHGMFREVSYIADKHGFRAHVKTNEPGTKPSHPAGVKMDAHPEPAFHKSHHSHEVHHGHH